MVCVRVFNNKLFCYFFLGKKLNSRHAYSCFLLSFLELEVLSNYEWISQIILCLLMPPTYYLRLHWSLETFQILMKHDAFGVQQNFLVRHESINIHLYQKIQYHLSILWINWKIETYIHLQIKQDIS